MGGYGPIDDVPSERSCWGGLLEQIFLEDPSPLSLLLLRFTIVSIGVSSGSAAGFIFFFLETFEGGTGEEAADLNRLLGSVVVSGAGSGAAGVDSRVTGVGSRGFLDWGSFLLMGKWKLLLLGDSLSSPSYE